MAENNGQTDNLQVAQVNNAVAITDPSAERLRLRLQNFSKLLSMSPPTAAIDSTPDGNAKTILISHIEMQLDELYFGLWETANFKWSVIANEVVGSLELVVVHPVTGQKITRTGAACVQITVDKVPEDIKSDPKKRNEWALDPSNKKSNALDLTFPKLKAECLKNAAQSLGPCFGRDLNRKPGKVATYRPRQKERAGAAADATAELLNPK
jgi:hypothetical protein